MGALAGPTPEKEQGVVTMIKDPRKRQASLSVSQLGRGKPLWNLKDCLCSGKDFKKGLFPLAMKTGMVLDPSRAYQGTQTILRPSLVV